MMACRGGGHTTTRRGSPPIPTNPSGGLTLSDPGLRWGAIIIFPAMPVRGPSPWADRDLDFGGGAALSGTIQRVNAKENDMETVKDGKFVTVAYTGTLENGDVFDTSQGRQPLEVQVGAGQLIEGFEKALLGMALNEKKVFTLAPNEAYGDRDDDLTRDFDRKEIPPEMKPEIGMTVGLNTPDGRQVPAQIVSVDEQTVTVDMNHPMAGKSLTFDIEVVGISDTPTQTPIGCGPGCDCGSGSGCC
jgi:peptidylprolyl isomerase